MPARTISIAPQNESCPEIIKNASGLGDYGYLSLCKNCRGVGLVATRLMFRKAYVSLGLLRQKKLAQLAGECPNTYEMEIPNGQVSAFHKDREITPRASTKNHHSRHKS
jgi:hypothetical protein